MSLKAIIIVGVGLLLALFGYNYYSSAKSAEKIAAYQAEAQKHKVEKEQIENHSKEDERLKKTAEAQQTRDNNRNNNSNSSNGWSSREVAQARISQSLANSSKNYEYRREELDVYRKMQSAASHMGTLIRATSSTKGEDRDAIFERMSTVRSEVASIDTKNSSCAADSKTKLLTAIDTSIEGARAALNKSRDNSTKEMAVSKIAIANEAIHSCINAIR